MITVSKKISFDAAHFLPDYDGKCKNLHGHHWSVELAVKGNIDLKTGMVLDFSILKDFLNIIKDIYDHKLLNDIIKNPTAEYVICDVFERWIRWIKGQRFPDINLAWIRVWETEDSCAEYRP